MAEQKLYRIDEISEVLCVSQVTILSWYDIQRKRRNQGEITEDYLPKYNRLQNTSGRPKVWTEEQVQQLKQFKESIVHGRHGLYGKYTNPKYVVKKNREV